MVEAASLRRRTKVVVSRVQTKRMPFLQFFLKVMCSPYTRIQKRQNAGNRKDGQLDCISIAQSLFGRWAQKEHDIVMFESVSSLS